MALSWIESFFPFPFWLFSCLLPPLSCSHLFLCTFSLFVCFTTMARHFKSTPCESAFLLFSFCRPGRSAPIFRRAGLIFFCVFFCPSSQVWQKSIVPLFPAFGSLGYGSCACPVFSVVLEVFRSLGFWECGLCFVFPLPLISLFFKLLPPLSQSRVSFYLVASFDKIW